MGSAASPFPGVVAVRRMAVPYPGSSFSPTFSHRVTESLGSPPRATENWGREVRVLQLQNSLDQRQSTVASRSPSKPTGLPQASLMSGAGALEQTHSLAKAGAGSEPP